jgi:phenylalanyl-tRNA synthetase beta chain
LLKTIGVSDIEESFLKNNWFSEGIEITKNKKLIVSFGLINDSVLEKLNIDSEVYLAEFDWDYINEIAYKSPLVYKEIFKYPSSRRDFALLLDESIDFDSIKKIAFKAESEILKSVDLFDFYKGNELEKGKKSYGISFIFQNDLKTLTDKQIDLVMNKLKIKFENELGAELR